jgi:glyoxylase-like metal-dependent hydrolase (beta-lactamase superfamily II)
MFFKQLKLGPMDNFSYFLADEKTKEAAIIDCGFEEEKLISLAKENDFIIKKILLTHAHYDHCQRVPALLEETNAELFLGEKEPFSFNTAKKILVKEGDEISLGSLKIKVIDTPGHTQGGVSYIMEDKLFTGDTLFIENVGRTDLQGGNLEILKESLEKIKSLPEDLTIYPGHDYGPVPSRKLKEEKEKNRFLNR